MTTELLTELNAFRANEGKAPITAWKKSRHLPMLEEYRANDDFESSEDELSQQQTRPSVVEANIANPDVMRPINEELGADIKATRAAWKSSGANMTKKEFAFSLMQSGATIKRLVDKMGITDTAARSLVADVRRMDGVTVTREGDVYYAHGADEEDDAGE